MARRYFREPDALFKMSGPNGADPPSVIPFMCTVRTGAEWEALGFKPYTFKDGNTHGWASCRRGGNWYRFKPRVLGYDQGWDQAYTDKKRHVDASSCVYMLRRMGLPYDQISNLTDAMKAEAEAKLAKG
jgi:hypothetical protein